MNVVRRGNTSEFIRVSHYHDYIYRPVGVNNNGVDFESMSDLEFVPHFQKVTKASLEKKKTTNDSAAANDQNAEFDEENDAEEPQMSDSDDNMESEVLDEEPD